MDVHSYFEKPMGRDWESMVDIETLRIAVVGLGGFAKTRALPALEETDYCEATVVVSGSSEKRQEVKKEFGINNGISYKEFKDGVKKDAYDAAFLALPNASHLEYTEAAAELGKHVLCEKPLEVNSNRAHQLVDVCDNAGVTLMTAYRLQAEPPIRRIRDFVQDGGIGDVIQVHGALSLQILDRGPRNQWRLDKSLAGGGALMDLGVYHVNTTRFLLGEDPAGVRAQTRSEHEAFDDVEEHIEFELLYDSTTALCTASYSGFPHSYVYLVGTDGVVRVDRITSLESRDIFIQTDDGQFVANDVDVNEVVEEFDYFAHCIRTGTTPEPDGEDGLRDVEIMDAIYEAADTDNTVSLR